MSSGIGVAVGFRTLQSIHDLRTLARSASDDTLSRIAAGMSIPSAKARLRHLIYDDGCLLTGADAESVHLSLLLSATLPDDDFDAFVTATAILVADRLQHGAGRDDLYWHWDAFQPHYQLAQPETRAVLLHGFLRMHEDGRVALQDPPAGAGLVSRSFDLVLSASRKVTDRGLARDLETSLQALEVAAWERLWSESWKMLRDGADQNAFTVFRHIYQTNTIWSPFRNTRFHAADENAPTIPFGGD